MDTVMELLYRATRTDNPLEAHGPDSAYAREHAIRREIIRSLLESMTMEQKVKFDEYGLADNRAREILNLESFCQAFHLGAQLTAELLQSKEEAFSRMESPETEMP